MSALIQPSHLHYNSYYGVVLEWIATASAIAAREVARVGERGFCGHVTCIMIVTRSTFSHMQRKSFGKMACPIARSLERVGEWWSILIIRDALHGFTRFDEFQKSLNIAPNMLTRRLSALVDAGLLQRRRYSERPPRYEYILTEMGRDFRPVIVAMFAWGNRHFAPEGASVLLVDKKTRAKADPVLVDRRSGKTAQRTRLCVCRRPCRQRAHTPPLRSHPIRNNSPRSSRRHRCAARKRRAS